MEGDGVEVVAGGVAATPAAGVPVMAVASGKNDTRPWRSLVIGERPYAVTAGIVASALERRDGSVSTTKAPEKPSPQGASAMLSHGVVAASFAQALAAISSLAPASSSLRTDFTLVA